MTTPPLRAVLCDDDAAIREVLTRVLARRGIEVVAASEDGCDCGRIAGAHQPDVVVLDLGLPDVDGATLIGVVRERAPAVGVVIYSGTDEPLVEQRVLALGADRFVVKATPAQQVAEIVEAAALEARARARL